MRRSKVQYHHAVRRLKRSQESIVKNKFVNAVKDGGVNIFKEIKHHRGVIKKCSSTIDGEVGAANIASHFANQYSNLYSKVNLGDDFDSLHDDIKNSVNSDNLNDIDRVSEAVVKEALGKLKAGKSDALFDFSSDCLINGPPQLITHLTQMLKVFLIHGFVPNYLLLCTLIPLVKDSLGDMQSSSNYCAIAISSLILKLMDWVILLLEGQKMTVDKLQFGYQMNISTSMCSWAVSSVIEHYNIRAGLYPATFYYG